MGSSIQSADRARSLARLSARLITVRSRVQIASGPLNFFLNIFWAISKEKHRSDLCEAFEPLCLSGEIDSVDQQRHKDAKGTQRSNSSSSSFRYIALDDHVQNVVVVQGLTPARLLEDAHKADANELLVLDLGQKALHLLGLDSDLRHGHAA
jgi:hypothetical protein